MHATHFLHSCKILQHAARWHGAGDKSAFRTIVCCPITKEVDSNLVSFLIMKSFL